MEAASAHVSIVAPHLLAALACEKYGMDDEALAYIGVIFDLHQKLGGAEAPFLAPFSHTFKNNDRICQDRLGISTRKH